MSDNTAMPEMVRSPAEAAEAVTTEEAQAYLGDHGHGVRFAERGFVLSVALRDTPLVSLGGAGMFDCSGHFEWAAVATACISKV